MITFKVKKDEKCLTEMFKVVVENNVTDKRDKYYFYVMADTKINSIIFKDCITNETTDICIGYGYTISERIDWWFNFRFNGEVNYITYGTI